MKKNISIVIPCRNEEKFIALEAEIIDYLPIDGRLKQYTSMRHLKLIMKDEAFRELQEHELVEKEAANPFKHF